LVFLAAPKARRVNVLGKNKSATGLGLFSLACGALGFRYVVLGLAGSRNLQQACRIRRQQAGAYSYVIKTSRAPSHRGRMFLLLHHGFGSVRAKKSGPTLPHRPAVCKSACTPLHQGMRTFEPNIQKFGKIPF
jgi:hypothetical protein